MHIIGPDFLVFGVDDLQACRQMSLDYGLVESEFDPVTGGIFTAMDGTGIIIRKSDDPSLPPAVAPAPNARQTIYGVDNQATLDAISAELSKDREVSFTNGLLCSVDDDGYHIAFQITIRKEIDMSHYGINVPGKAPGRAMNQIAAIEDEDIKALSLSHVVFFTSDKVRAEEFYAKRLGFITVDIFSNLGPFMRPAGTNEHHTLFLIQSPNKGLQHFTFHFAGANELCKVGFELVKKGYTSFWGPGRHVLGSNFFWYFNSPFGALMELDADMDLHDSNWTPRTMHADQDSSQTFLLQYTEKWTPRGKH